METFEKNILACEKRYMLRCLKKAEYSVQHALHISGLARSQFYRILKRTGIELPDYGSDERPFYQVVQGNRNDTRNLH
jgi:transcriptional regulator with GAF, ATPase, and Fis domain